jgi:hypothetical protein
MLRLGPCWVRSSSRPGRVEAVGERLAGDNHPKARESGYL